MATGQEKFQIVFEAQENASAKIRELSARLAELGGPQMVKSQNEIKKLERQINQLSGTAQTGFTHFSKLADSFAIGSLAAKGIEKALGSVRSVAEACWNAILENEKAATQLEGALKRLGAATPQNISQIENFAQSMQKAVGVSDELIVQLSSRLLTAGASWADTQKVIITANDHAAAGYGTLEENVGALATVLETGLTRGLKGLKVTVDQNLGAVDQFHYALRQMSDMTGGQASTNAGTLAGKVDIMKESWDRFFETVGGDNLSNFKGAVDLLGQMATVATAAYKGLKGLADFGGIGAAMNKDLQARAEIIRELGAGADRWSKEEIAAARAVKQATSELAETTKASQGMIDLAREQSAEKAASLFTENYKLILRAAEDADKVLKQESDKRDRDYEKALDQAKQQRDDLLTLWSGYAKAREKTNDDIFAASLIGETASTQAIMKVKEAYASRINEIDSTMYASHEEWSKARQANDALYAAALAQAEANARAAKIEFDRKAFDAARRLAEESKTDAQKALESMVTAMVQSVGTWVGAVIKGRANIGQAFRGMASDFLNIFINAVIQYVENILVVKILALLSGLFDNPTNDRMAAKQGSDFAFHFQRGVLGMLGNNLAAGIGQQNRITPVAQTAGSGGGMVVMNVTVAGNVLSDHYIEKTIKPRLQQLATDGKAFLSLKSEYQTGSRNVRFD